MFPLVNFKTGFRTTIYNKLIWQEPAIQPKTKPTSNTTSHENHEKINSLVSFSFPYEYGAPLGGSSGRRSSTINRACKNDASNPKKKRKPLQHLKGIKSLRHT